jgi:hypothetical protein
MAVKPVNISDSSPSFSSGFDVGKQTNEAVSVGVVTDSEGEADMLWINEIKKKEPTPSKRKKASRVEKPVNGSVFQSRVPQKAAVKQKAEVVEKKEVKRPVLPKAQPVTVETSAVVPSEPKELTMDDFADDIEDLLN